jgi:hypothetical protein
MAKMKCVLGESFVLGGDQEEKKVRLQKKREQKKMDYEDSEYRYPSPPPPVEVEKEEKPLFFFSYALSGWVLWAFYMVAVILCVYGLSIVYHTQTCDWIRQVEDKENVVKSQIYVSQLEHMT